MKNKIIITLTVAAAAALVFVISCAKQEQTQTVGDGMTFTATIEQDLTKTTITGERKVEWVAGDRVSINGALYSAVPKTPASRAEFIHMSGNAPKAAPYKAIYPATLYNASTKGYEFPSTITYEAGKLNTPMYAESDTEELSFKNICGVLCLSLTGPEVVKSITVTANENICGPFSIDIAQDGSFVTDFTGTGKTITIDCGEQGVQLSNVAKDFFIPLPPQEYTAGLIIAVNVIDSEEAEFNKTTITNLNIERNTIYTISGYIEKGKIGTHSYIKIGNKKWATMNIGANDITDFGDYYVWGATTTAYESITPSSQYNATFTFKDTNPYGDAYSNQWNASQGYCWQNTPFTQGVYSDGNTGVFTKYVKKTAYGYNAFVDDKGVLDSNDDAAHVNWGDTWRIPTIDDFYDLFSSGYTELTTNYNGTNIRGYIVYVAKGNDAGWITYSSTKRYKFKSNAFHQDSEADTHDFQSYSTDSDPHLFFPAAGRLDSGLIIRNLGQNGDYWTSTLSDYASCYSHKIGFACDAGSNNNINLTSLSRNEFGSIRPVSD